MFGDLDVSRIDEAAGPHAGRHPGGASPTAIIHRLKEAVRGGAQAFWICPMVSESDFADLAAADARRELQKIMGAQVGLVHGQMAAAEKDAVMAQFAEGRLPVRRQRSSRSGSMCPTPPSW